MTRARATFRACLALATTSALVASAQPIAGSLVVGPGTDAGATVVVNEPATFTDVSVEAGGRLVVNAPLVVSGDFVVRGAGVVMLDATRFGDAGVPVLRLDVDGGLVVEVGGAIDLLGAGFPPWTTGDPVSGGPVRYFSRGSDNAPGGSHVALGGGGSAPPSYDAPLAPRLPGAGSGIARGGGALVARATMARIDGVIRADGAPGHTRDSAASGGGSAGGSVSLEAGELAGGGLVSVAGGECTVYYHAYSCGGGAGGAVRLAFRSSTFAGRFAVGAGSTPSASQPSGGAGSAVLVGRGVGAVTVAVTVAAGVLPLRAADAFKRVALASGAELRVEGPAAVDEPVAIPAGATLTLASERALERLRFVPVVRGTLRLEVDVALPETDLVVAAGGVLVVDRRLSVRSLEVEAGGLVTHSPEVRTMHVVAAQRLHVAAGGRVDATGLGLAEERTVDPLSGAVVVGSVLKNGGSHGGLGGLYESTVARAQIYDDPASPSLPGGGGGSYSGAGQRGGGVIRLSAGELVVDGAVVADGLATASTFSDCSGSGAGGSVVLEAGALAGGGAVSARGGSARAVQVCGGGGGGLVLLGYGTKSFTGSVSVDGGVGRASGEPGKVTEATRSLAPRIVTAAPSRAFAGLRLSYAARASGTPPFMWSLDEGPSGASVDVETGALGWTPGDLAPGVFALTVRNAFGSETHRFTVTVETSPAAGDGGVVAPAFLSTPDTAAPCGSPYRYSGAGAPVVSGTGPFSFSVGPALGVPLPPTLTVDEATGELRWSPTRADVGAHPLELLVSGPGGSARQVFAIVVTCSPPTEFSSGCGCQGSRGALGGPSELSGLGALVAALAARARLRRSPRRR